MAGTDLLFNQCISDFLVINSLCNTAGRRVGVSRLVGCSLDLTPPKFEIKLEAPSLSNVLLTTRLGFTAITSSPSSVFKSLVIASFTVHSIPTFVIPSITIRSSFIDNPAI